MSKLYSISHSKGDLQLGAVTRIMGIINLTPDSFSNDGFGFNVDDALAHAKAMVDDGADIIDVGGESSRPGSNPISEEEEIDRVIPFIEELSKSIDQPISIDTYKSVVAEKALKAGAGIINDISAFHADKNMIDLAVRSQAPVILMHMKGSPSNMQDNTEYGDVVSEIKSFFIDRLKTAADRGLNRDKIIVDPGIGFGKNLLHNLEILKRLDEFKMLDCPIMIGASRKSFIGKITGRKSKGDRLPGSLAVASIAISSGAHLIRVHDVKETVDVARICDAVRN